MKSLMSLPNNFSTIQVDKCLQKCGGHHRWFLVSGQNLSLRPHKDPLVHDVVAMGRHEYDPLRTLVKTVLDRMVFSIRPSDNKT